MAGKVVQGCKAYPSEREELLAVCEGALFAGEAGCGRIWLDGGSLGVINKINEVQTTHLMTLFFKIFLLLQLGFSVLTAHLLLTKV